jgi:hypothetical protein
MMPVAFAFMHATISISDWLAARRRQREMERSRRSAPKFTGTEQSAG